MSSKGPQVRRKIGVWSFLILAGLVAYGLGLYQGSQFRMQRTIASMQKPMPVEIQSEVQGAAPTAGLAKPSKGPSKAASPSNSPSNTELPKSHSKSH